MTDENIGTAPAPSAPAPSAPAPTQESTAGLKTLHQDQIDSIVREAHHRGYSKRDRELSAAQTQQQAQPQQTQQHSGVPLTPEEVRRMVAEESARQVQNAQLQASAELVVNQFQQKMAQGAAKYPDFAAQVGKLDLGKMVDLVQMSSALDNTADVMYELATNPYKIASLQQLAQMQPQLAYSEIQKLSASIKANQTQAPAVNAPLSQINASPIGVSNDSLPDIDYFSKKYRG